MMTRSALAALALPALLLACSGPAGRAAGNGAQRAANASPEAQAAPAVPPSPLPGSDGDRPAAPAAPGTPAGLPDEGTPVSEAPFAATSAQGAADVVQTYYALVEAGRYADARRLWGAGSEGGGPSDTAFAAGFARYAEYHAQVGAPGAIEGAAGSSYVEVPVSLYGRLKAGAAFRQAATVTLRRVNDVPGSTPAQRRWHIVRIQAKP